MRKWAYTHFRVLQSENLMSRVDREVLIVEDDPPLQRLLAAIVLRNGLVPIVAGDGRTALELLSATQFDAILLDLMLPVVNGFDVLRHLWAENPELMARTIVITAAEERVYRNSPAVRHAHALLRKPFDVAHLQAEMLACCNGVRTAH
jgi:two-component system response regulator CpxR